MFSLLPDWESVNWIWYFISKIVTIKFRGALETPTVRIFVVLTVALRILTVASRLTASFNEYVDAASAYIHVYAQAFLTNHIHVAA